MNQPPFIIDAHTHLGSAGQMLFSGANAREMVRMMDRLSIRLAFCSDHAALLEGSSTGLTRMRRIFDESAGRIRTLAVFDPRDPGPCLRDIERSLDWDGLAGIKIHPSFHRTAADDESYRPVWSLAEKAGLSILTHAWSISDYNASQALSTPERFERWVEEIPSVRLVLAHAGGRGNGRLEAIRIANEHPNVYLDFAGDIFCYRLIESLVGSVPIDKILFGSDYPWTGPADHLSRVLLANISDDAKAKILHENATAVYRLKGPPC